MGQVATCRRHPSYVRSETFRTSYQQAINQRRLSPSPISTAKTHNPYVIVWNIPVPFVVTGLLALIFLVEDRCVFGKGV